MQCSTSYRPSQSRAVGRVALPRRRRAPPCAATPAAAATAAAADANVATAKRLYEEVWSRGNVRALGQIMAPDHAQHDVCYQPAPALGRERMVRGVLAYRAAYPDIAFAVQEAAAVESGAAVFVHWCALALAAAAPAVAAASASAASAASATAAAAAEGSADRLPPLFRHNPIQERDGHQPGAHPGAAADGEGGRLSRRLAAAL